MRRFFGKFENNRIKIEDDDFLHLKNVLRLNVGDEIIVSIDDEYDYYARIETLDKKACYCQCIEKKHNEANPKRQIDLFQGAPKGDKIELIVQKAVELGVNNVTIFSSEFTIGKVSENKLLRLKKISKEACKQCGRSVFSKISTMDFETLLKTLTNYDVIIFAYEKAERLLECEDFVSANKIAIVVGAEGGFSVKEAEKLIFIGAKAISLGKRILRCETAPIMLLSVIGFLKGN